MSGALTLLPSSAPVVSTLPADGCGTRFGSVVRIRPSLPRAIWLRSSWTTRMRPSTTIVEAASPCGTIEIVPSLPMSTDWYGGTAIGTWLSSSTGRPPAVTSWPFGVMVSSPPRV